MLALAVLPGLRASCAIDGESTVIQIIRPLDGDTDSDLQDILSRFLSIEIERAGLKPAVETGSGPVNEAGLGAIAKRAEARFVLLARYRRMGRQVLLELQWYDAAAGRVVVRVERTGQIDLDMDSLVASAAAAIFDQTGARRPRVAGIEGAAPGPQPAPAPLQRPKPSEPSAPFVASLSLSGLLVTGYASDYFKYGLMPSFFVGYRLPVGEGALSAGGGAGYGRFLTQGDLAGVEIDTIPFAVGVRYETAGSGPLVVYFRAEAGAAVLRVLPAGGSGLSKVVPFGVAGIGLAFPVTGEIGLTLETSYAVYVESENPIQGFMPAVGSYVRWGR